MKSEKFIAIHYEQFKSDISMLVLIQIHFKYKNQDVSVCRTIKSVQYKTILSDLWITPPFIKGCEFDKTKPRLTFEIFPDKVGAGGTIKLKVS